VILYRNALKVEHEALRDLEVIETIKQGRTVYRANAARDRSEL
jgi:predicted amidohydrolase YtcJ